MRVGSVRAAVMAVTAAVVTVAFSTPAGHAGDFARAETASSAATRDDLRGLRQQAGTALVVGRAADGTVRMLGSRVDRPLATAEATAEATAPRTPEHGSRHSPAATARGYAVRFGGALGLEPEDGLRVVHVERHGTAGTTVRLQQSVDDLPVLGGEVVVGLDDADNLTSLGGEATSEDLNAFSPEVPEEAAVRTAVQATRRDHGVGQSVLAAGEPKLWFYDPELLGNDDPFGARPVWRVEVSDGLAVRDLVLVDAATGRVVIRMEQVHGIDRVVCDRANMPFTGPYVDDCQDGVYVRTEADGPTDDPEVELAFDHAGATAGFFHQVAGVDLTSLIGYNAGDGRKLRSTVRVCVEGEQCPWPNAFWNGRGMYYGDGYAAADDVVAHELTHGVVEHTAGLFYWYQSGALNESFADVFGELVDSGYGSDDNNDAWLIGEDTPQGAMRHMAQPAYYFGHPDKMTSPFYVSDPNLYDNGGVHVNSGVGNKAAALIAEGGRFNGYDVTGLDVAQPHKPKTAAIYWRALQMLTSASDYEDLYWVLPQACRDLAAVGTAGLVPADCEQVAKAVEATEMNRQPVDPDAAAPEAARCSTPSDVTRRFFDDVETQNTAWALNGVWGRSPREDMPYEYATSGRRSFFGWDPDPALYEEPTDSRLTLRQSFAVPRDGDTFLRFDHSYLFEWYDDGLGGRRYVDGGRVEYSTDNGLTWANAARLPWVNGPNRALIAAGGHAGFGGDSHGYTSSRLDLSSLAGKDVQLRWRITGDEQGSSGDGWWLDDVEVYTCAARAPGMPQNVEVGGGAPGKIGAGWEPPDWQGSGIAGYRVTANPGRHAVDVSEQSRSALLTGLDQGVTYRVDVQAFTADGDLGEPSRHTVVGTRVTVRAPSAVTYGRGRLTGRLARADTGTALPGNMVRVESRPSTGGKWALVDFADVGRRGRFSVPLTAKVHMRYRVEFEGGARWMGSRSADVLVQVRPRLTASLASSPKRRGEDAWLYGRVYPTMLGEPLRLQRQVGTRWRTIERIRMERRSYRFDLPTRRTGRFVYRVSTPASEVRLGAVSPSRRLRVY